MKFQIIALVSALAATVAADMHNYCICANWNGNELEYAESATKQMCSAYLKRNTGSGWWETCPDCTYVVADELCRSAAKHMGGDQVREYCGQFGATESRC